MHIEHANTQHPATPVVSAPEAVKQALLPDERRAALRAFGLSLLLWGAAGAVGYLVVR